MALQAYRNLLRAAQLAFRDDMAMLSAARSEIRSGFRDKADINATDESVSAGIKHADDVAKILRENIVQGRRTDGAEGTYKLRIHEHTERGNNDSIQTAGSGATSGGCGCR